MENWIFVLSNYAPNPHALPPLFVGVLVILLGIDVLFRQRGSKVSKIFIALCSAVGILQITYWGILSAFYPAIAMIWISIHNLILAFIPSLFYLFTLTITKQFEKYRSKVWICFLLSTLFFTLFVNTELFAQGLYMYSWGYHLKVGPSIFLFIAFYLALLTTCLWFLWKDYKESPSQTHKRRMRTFFIVLCVASLSSINYLASFGLPVYPFGYVFIFIALILAARGIWLYRIVDITPTFAAKHIITSISDILLVVDDRGIIRIVNQAANDFFGNGKKNLIGLPLDEINSDFISSETMDSLFQSKKPFDYEVELMTATGKAILSVSTSVLLDETEESLAIVCIAKNITDKKRMKAALQENEELLRRAQKMEAVGRLAGGIAHDFNNIVTPIMGYTDLALSKVDKSDPLYGQLEHVKMAAEKAASITNQLLTFSKHHVVAPQILNLNKTISEMDNLLRRIIGKDIEMVTLFAKDIWFVKIDTVQLEQVIINLAVNARDAMPDGGKFVLETSNVELNFDQVHVNRRVDEGKYVMIAISDTGHGMNKETQAKIFEPFFTTKDKSKGTGLGLATSYGIIEKAGGHILVYSELNHGTTMKILLPSVEGEAENIAKRGPLPPMPRGTETVLLVEDEPLVHSMVCAVLREQGYTVIEMQNGSEALHFFKKDKREKIDLVFTDVIMPQMGGKELADEIHKKCPEMKILFTSGYTDGAIFHHGIVDPDINFIPKPFSPIRLALKVREVLDKE